LVLERAHERAPDARAAEGPAHGDALGLRVPVDGDPQPRRADRLAPVEGEEVHAGGVVLVHLLGERHALLLDEDLAPDGEAARALVGAGAPNLEAAHPLASSSRRSPRTTSSTQRPSMNTWSRRGSRERIHSRELASVCGAPRTASVRRTSGSFSQAWHSAASLSSSGRR